MYQYKYYQSGNKVIALSTFAGRPVRGIAKCDPNDAFSLEAGKKLAAARCNHKISEKRAKFAKKKLAVANAAFEEAQKQAEFMSTYYTEAMTRLYASEVELEDLLKTL